MIMVTCFPVDSVTFMQSTMGLDFTQVFPALSGFESINDILDASPALGNSKSNNALGERIPALVCSESITINDLGHHPSPFPRNYVNEAHYLLPTAIDMNRSQHNQILHASFHNISCYTVRICFTVTPAYEILGLSVVFTKCINFFVILRLWTLRILHVVVTATIAMLETVKLLGDFSISLRLSYRQLKLYIHLLKVVLHRHLYLKHDNLALYRRTYSQYLRKQFYHYFICLCIIMFMQLLIALSSVASPKSPCHLGSESPHGSHSAHPQKRMN